MNYVAVPPSQHDIKNIEEIITGGYGTWFSAKLLRLIRDADTNNRELIRQVFPDHVAAFEAWYYKGDE